MKEKQKKSKESKLKSMTKSEYIEQLCEITRERAKKLTIKQLRTLIVRHALS